jgi:trans-2,3-dihydro-3-hydroxyanthranilate isomerase
MPWAGHPNVGTAWALGLRAGTPLRGPRRWRFEETAGLVTVDLEADDATGAPTEARVLAPQALALSAGPTVAEAARCLGLPATSIVADGDRVPVATVGFPFPLVELADRQALRRARGDLAAMADALPPLGLDGVIAYTRDVDAADHAVFAGPAGATGSASAPPRADLSVRMFAPLMGILEDPATGSGVAALAAALALREGTAGLRRWSVAQGVDMGRPSGLSTRVEVAHGRTAAVQVGGACVPVMEGRLRLD